MDQKLSALRALVVGSPIRAVPLRQPNALDSGSLRRSADADALILAWIAGHTRGSAQRSRLN